MSTRGRLDVSQSITVDRSPEDLTEMLTDPEQLSRVVGEFADVSSAAGDRLYWTVHGPRGLSTSFTVEIIEHEPGERLRWKSEQGASVPNEGEIRLRNAAGDRGTVVSLEMQADPPGGPLGAIVMQQLDIVPDTLAERFLQRFKSLAETGEIRSLDHNPSGRGSGDLV